MAQLQGQISAYLEDKLLDHILGTASYTMPTDVYLALYEDDPTDADTGTEVTAGGYARQVATFAAASGGAAVTDADVEFGRFTEGVTVTHWGARDADVAGNLLLRGPLVDDSTLGAADSQFDVTKSGNLVTYTWDGTGTDPAITATNPKPGDVVLVDGDNFSAANNGRFTVVTAGVNYFTVENEDGVAEDNKTLGATGSITRLTPVSLSLPNKSKLTIEAGDMTVRLD